jgi:hypothetical protein
MSDALSAALAVALIPIVMMRNRRWVAYVAGLVAGYGVLVRLSALVVLGALIIAWLARSEPPACHCGLRSAVAGAGGVPVGDIRRSLENGLRLLAARPEVFLVRRHHRAKRYG